jgi:YebC/PmpR family DNA-binding regulatory protein
MSGHSKWANIKERKGSVDKKRSEAFTKIAKNILTAIRVGGSSTDVEVNSHLRVAIEKAKEANMPKENIERLLASFEQRKANLASFVFEGYGPYGVPILIEVESDNKNRILSEIKSILKEYEGTLGESGSVSFRFTKVGEIESEELPEKVELELIDAGAEEFEDRVVVTKPERLDSLVKKMESLGLRVVRSEVVMRVMSPVILDKESQLQKLLDLIEALEDNEEVVRVSAGFDYVEKI